MFSKFVFCWQILLSILRLNMLLGASWHIVDYSSDFLWGYPTIYYRLNLSFIRDFSMNGIQNSWFFPKHPVHYCYSIRLASNSKQCSIPGVQHSHRSDVVHRTGPGDEHGQDWNNQFSWRERSQWNKVLVKHGYLLSG